MKCNGRECPRCGATEGLMLNSHLCHKCYYTALGESIKKENLPPEELERVLLDICFPQDD